VLLFAQGRRLFPRTMNVTPDLLFNMHIRFHQGDDKQIRPGHTEFHVKSRTQRYKNLMTVVVFGIFGTFWRGCVASVVWVSAAVLVSAYLEMLPGRCTQ